MFSNTRNVGIFGGTFTDHNVQHHHHGPSLTVHNAKKSAIDRLIEASSLGALHNSGERFDPPKCHPNTRTAVLQKLMDWLIRKIGWDTFVLWLYGPAGAGKSAIVQTFAEQCSRTNGLLASFFFSRSDPKRNNEKALVATLAYQVTLSIPAYRTILETAIDRDPAIFQLNFETQFQTLILDPLLQLSTTDPTFTSGKSLPYLFIIDGLDECIDSDVQRTILNTLSKALQKHRLTLPFVFLIASRPEYHLAIPFADASLNNLTFRLALDDTYQPDTDIRLYLIDSFRNIRKTHILRAHLPDSWPSRDDVAELVIKSSGQFIYAATMIRYVSSPRHSPLNRLKVIHGLLPANNDKPYAQLDALYINILSGVEDIEATLRVLGFWQVLRPDDFDSIDKMEQFMLLDPGSIRLLLLDLLSVVAISDLRIKFLHASFVDFLFDPTRSLQYYINPNRMHEEAARLCITHINLCYSSDVIVGAGGSLLPISSSALPRLVDHLQRVGPLHDNVTLREEVLNTTYVQSLNLFNKNWNPLRCHGFHAGGFLAKFLNFLQTSDFWNTEELYLHHRGLWDRFIHEDLALVHKKLNHELAFWIACLVTLEQIPEAIYIETIMALTSAPPKPEAVPDVPFSFFTGETHPHTVIFYEEAPGYLIASHFYDHCFDINTNYLAILTAFLADPTRAGTYTANEATYIMAAEFVVAFVVRPWDEKKKMVVCNRGQWDFIWDAVISLLSIAGHSDEVVALVLNGDLTFSLGRPDYNLRVRLRSMFRAVSDYLLKCTGTVPTGFHIVIDWTQWKPYPRYRKYKNDDDICTDRPFLLDSSINA